MKQASREDSPLILLRGVQPHPARTNTAWIVLHHGRLGLMYLGLARFVWGHDPAMLTGPTLVSDAGTDLERSSGSRDGSETEDRVAGTEIGDIDDVGDEHVPEVRDVSAGGTVHKDCDDCGSVDTRLASRTQPGRSQSLDGQEHGVLIACNEVIVCKHVSHTAPAARAARSTGDGDDRYNEHDREPESRGHSL
jgi:hypothetical protein